MIEFDCFSVPLLLLFGYLVRIVLFRPQLAQFSGKAFTDLVQRGGVEVNAVTDVRFQFAGIDVRDVGEIGG